MQYYDFRWNAIFTALTASLLVYNVPSGLAWFLILSSIMIIYRLGTRMA